MTLGLLVAPRTTNEPAREAVFVLTGGPGAAATTGAEGFLDMLRPLRASYDLVLLNQRGTAGENKLQCESVFTSP